jgi:DNA repair ATPase RecN
MTDQQDNNEVLRRVDERIKDINKNPDIRKLLDTWKLNTIMEVTSITPNYGCWDNSKEVVDFLKEENESNASIIEFINYIKEKEKDFDVNQSEYESELSKAYDIDEVRGTLHGGNSEYNEVVEQSTIRDDKAELESLHRELAENIEVELNKVYEKRQLLQELLNYSKTVEFEII